MGAFGGIVAYHAGVTEPELRLLGGALARYGPDGEHIAVEGSVGMVYRQYGTHAIEVEQASLWRAHDGALLAFEGRLDNGPELAALLGLRGLDARQDSTT